MDYIWEFFGGCFGFGCKIVGGYDFVGDDYDGINDFVLDNDFYDNCYFYGIFIFGIIGVNENVYGVVGVVFELSLYVYRVFGCNGVVLDDIVFVVM